MSAKFTRPNDERLVQQPACLEILDEPGDRLIHLMRHRPVTPLEVAVLIPRVGAVPGADALIQAA